MSRKKKEMTAPMIDHEVSLHVRRIKNGYLVRHTQSGPNVTGGYKSEEVYHRKHPMQHSRVSSMFKSAMNL